MNFISTLMTKILSIIFGLMLLSLDLSAQQIFVDSGQRLGNSASWDIKLGDIDGDGDPDAVLANNFWNNVIPQHNEIWFNNGNATFIKSQQQLDPSNTITLYDVDNDGDFDIIENGDWQTAVIKTWLNDGYAHFSLSNKFPFRGNKIIFDNNFSGQDYNDVVTLETGTNTIIRIYSISNDTAVVENTFTLNSFGASAMAAGDINGDGYCDIVTGQTGPTNILLNDKQGGFTISDQKLGNYICSNIYLGDLNGDGFPDMLQCNYHTMENSPRVQPAQFYLNDGNGKFIIATLPYDTNYLTQSAELKDLNNDGYLDIFMNHYHRYQDWDRPSEILFNDGHASFTTTTINLPLIQSDEIDFGDLDGDGDFDAFLAVTKIIDDNHYGGSSRVWLNTTIATSVENEKGKTKIPDHFQLDQNYPNPFNPKTVIRYSIPAVGTSFMKSVRLKIYDQLGREITTLVNGMQSPGMHTIEWNAQNYPSGVYFYRLQADMFNETRKLVLLK